MGRYFTKENLNGTYPGFGWDRADFSLSSRTVISGFSPLGSPAGNRLGLGQQEVSNCHASLICLFYYYYYDHNFITIIKLFLPQTVSLLTSTSLILSPFPGTGEGE